MCRLTAVRMEMPTSIPIMRATTTSADASPCIRGCTDASIDALTGAIARPKPRPQATSTGSLGCSHPGPNGTASVVAVPPVIARSATAGGVAETLAEPAAGNGADRHADQETEQDQRGAELRIRVHRGPGEHGDVEQRRHQRGSDREVGQQRSVGAPR